MIKKAKKVGVTVSLAQPKTRQKGEIFSLWYGREFDLNVLFIHFLTRKCLLMPLFLLYAPK